MNIFIVYMKINQLFKNVLKNFKKLAEVKYRAP